MKQIVLVMVMCLYNQLTFAQTTRYNVVSNSQNQTVIEVNVGDFKKNPVNSPNGNEVSIQIDKGSSLLEKGNPDLPKLAFSIVIPNQKNSSISLLDSKFIDYPNVSVAPSKGQLTRNINPSTVPYVYGTSYQTNEFFPQNLISLNAPYILRDFRGQTVLLNPVQYNPVTKVLRVYSFMKLEIKYDGMSTANILSTTEAPKTIVEEYDGIYENHFINYRKRGTRYTPVLEQGSLLIFCPASFLPEIAPFVKWKKIKGIRTFVVNTDTIAGGVTETNIKNLSKWYYQNQQIAYMLIIGDNANIPPVTSSFVKGPSDIAYAYITPNDHYPEFAVGRFSGESKNDIQNQVNRTLQYEITPNISSNWMQTQIGIASDEGTGDDAQYDWEHIHDIVDSNKNQYNYLNNIEMFDGIAPVAGTDLAGDPSASMLTNAINQGSSLINYAGHGGWDGIVTTNFSIPDVANLTNNTMPPFFFTVGCQPGNFTSSTCFSETIQRASNGGTIACFMSTVDQYWDEPMQAQDEFNAILRGARPSNLKQRLGPICMDACMSMNDQYNTTADPKGGSDMTDTWVFFGDPTLSLFTKNEGSIILSNIHPIQQNSTTYQLSCNVNGATIGLYYQGEFLASAVVSGGNANFTFPAVMVLDTVSITATKQNYLPVSTYVNVVNWPLEVNDIVEENGLSVYPNPTTDQIQVKLKESQLITQINIIDAQGKISYSQFGNGNTATINTKHLASGIYNLSITTKEGILSKSFLKK